MPAGEVTSGSTLSNKRPVQSLAAVACAVIGVLAGYSSFLGSTVDYQLPIVIPTGKIPLGINWQIIPQTGWGTFGENLITELLQSPEGKRAFYPVVAREQLFWDDVGVLARLKGQQADLPAWFHQNSRYHQKQTHQKRTNFPILHATSGGTFRPSEGNLVWGSKNIAVTFFETVALTPEALEAARSYDLILAGSEYNSQMLRSKYKLPRVATAWQGVDTGLFRPDRGQAGAGPSAATSSSLSGRFVVFSGGKLEMRKGQDIVVKAFAQFLANGKHDDAVLVTSWHNRWPKLVSSISSMGLVSGSPADEIAAGEDYEAQLPRATATWLAKNGISEAHSSCTGLLPKQEVAEILRRADVAVFTNRAEGGTNLVAMEAMAAGVPTIISNNTGHIDIIQGGEHCYPIGHYPMADVAPKGWASFIEGWGEPRVEEVVRLLERAYAERDEAKAKGAKAAAFIRRHFTWEQSAKRISQLVSEI
jgi:glycosyltransferase involved in cell wall biosynthesis